MQGELEGGRKGGREGRKGGKAGRKGGREGREEGKGGRKGGREESREGMEGGKMKGRGRLKEEEVQREVSYSGCPLHFHWECVGSYTGSSMERRDV